MNRLQHLIYEFKSILEPLDLSKLFIKAQRLEVELGCGDSSFLVEHAAANPGTNFAGVERLLGRLRKLERKGRLAGLTNLCGLRIESAYFLQYLLPEKSTAALHIYFPDPWPKRRHAKNRLVNERFVQLAARVLVAGGTVYLRTDDKNYFEQMKKVFGANPEFRAVETPSSLSAVRTDFEKSFNARGIETLCAAYRLIKENEN